MAGNTLYVTNLDDIMTMDYYSKCDGYNSITYTYSVFDKCSVYSNDDDNTAALMYEIQSFVYNDSFYLLIVTDMLSMTIYQVKNDLSQSTLLRNIKIMYLSQTSSSVINDVNMIYYSSLSSSSSHNNMKIWIMISFYDGWEDNTFAQVFEMDENSLELQLYDDDSAEEKQNYVIFSIFLCCVFQFFLFLVR